MKTPVVTGRDLMRARINAGLSRRAFCKQVGLHDIVVRRFETDPDTGLRPDSAKKIADWLGCKVTDLEPFRRQLEDLDGGGSR